MRAIRGGNSTGDVVIERWMMGVWLAVFGSIGTLTQD